MKQVLLAPLAVVAFTAVTASMPSAQADECADIFSAKTIKPVAFSWGRSKSPAQFEKLAGAVRKDLEKHMTFTRINADKNVNWLGPSFPKHQGGDRDTFETLLTAEQLRRTEQEQGRDTLDSLIQAYLQVGIEQGRRSLVSSYKVIGTSLSVDSAKAAFDVGTIPVTVKMLDHAKSLWRSISIEDGVPETETLPFQRQAHGKVDWPHGAVQSSEIIANFVVAITSAYKIEAKPGQMDSVDSILTDRLAAALNLAVQQGKRVSLSPKHATTSYRVISILLDTLRREIGSASPQADKARIEMIFEMVIDDLKSFRDVSNEW